MEASLARGCLQPVPTEAEINPYRDTNILLVLSHIISQQVQYLGENPVFQSTEITQASHFRVVPH